MTLVDYSKYSDGHISREENEWERTRLIASLIYNTNAKKGKGKKLEEFIPLRKDKIYAKERLKKAKEARKMFEKMQAEGKDKLDG